MIQNADIGVIGLAVMGKNLILNINDNNFTVAIFNRTVSKVDDFVRNEAKGRTTILPSHNIEEFISKLKRPRKVLLMVKAGSTVDEFIGKILPYLEPGDLIVDGGNSLFTDTTRRTKELESQGFLYSGTGISGGEEGARHGPSMMPGGSQAAWPLVKDIFQSIAAKTKSGEICCDWVGDYGAGHFVKMVHNGIEYGDMQLICEVYQLLKVGLGLSNAEMQDIFAEWNKGDLDSYLIEITAEILGTKDGAKDLVDIVLDTAGQKGTGKWTGMNALDLGTPLTLIGEAVFARYISAMKEERVTASKLLNQTKNSFSGDKKQFIKDLAQALFASKIVSYAQGYMLMKRAAQEYSWDINYGGVALMWRGGCIIRSAFLGKIKEAYDKNPALENLLLDKFFTEKINKAEGAWRNVVGTAVKLGIPIPALSSALSFFDSYRSAWLPANLLQAQRDYFGSHTFERVDRARGEFFHFDWINSKN